MRSTALLIWLNCLCISAENTVLEHFYVVDLQGKPVAGIVISPVLGRPSPPTDENGRTRITMIRSFYPGKDVPLEIDGDSPWTFFSPRFTISCPDSPEEKITVRVIRKGDPELLASSEALQAITTAILDLIEPNVQVGYRSIDEARQQAALAQVATNTGLGVETIDQSLRLWKDRTSDPFDSGLMALYERQFAEASEMLRPLVEAAQRRQDETYAEKLYFSGRALFGEGKYQEASRAFHDASGLRPGNRSYAAWLGTSLSRMGAHAEAETVIAQVFDHDTRSLGERHPVTLVSMTNLASTLFELGDYEAARALEEQALVISLQFLARIIPIRSRP